MQTIIYIRTSTTEQNPENQLEQCLTLEKEGNYEVIEDKQSAWNEKKHRHGFDRLRRLIKANRVKNIIVWDLDRLYRNRKNLIAFFKLCKAYGCRIHPFRQQWLEELNNMPKPFNEMMYDLMLQIMGWIAEEESTKKSERVKQAVRREGGITKSYKGNKWGRKSISKQAISKVLELNKQGYSIRDIASMVTYTDKNNQPKNLSVGLVHKILSNSTKENTS